MKKRITSWLLVLSMLASTPIYAETDNEEANDDENLTVALESMRNESDDETAEWEA